LKPCTLVFLRLGEDLGSYGEQSEDNSQKNDHNKGGRSAAR